MQRPHLTQTLLALSLLPAACTTKPGSLGGVEDGDGDGDADGGGATEGESATSNGDGAGDTEGDDAESGDDTGDPPEACTEELGPSEARVLDAHKWTNAVTDLLGIVPPPAPLPEEATVGPFYVGLPDGATAASFATAATEVATNLSDGFFDCGDVDDETCLALWVDDVAARAWRRSITDTETETFLALPGVSLDERGRALVESVLASPNFYEITETGSSDPEDPTRILLDRRSTATRLAHLVWNSVPDTQLIEAAETGALSDPQARREEVQRMWADARTHQMIDDYYEQWLGLGRLRINEKDIPEWTDELPQAMLDETGRFAARVIIDQGGTWADLLTAPFSVINGPLATLVYGDDIDGPAPTGDAFEVVSFDPVRRAGILSLSGPMSAWSGHASIGISRRGYSIVDRLVCVAIPPEPIGVDPDIPDNEVAESRHDFQQAAFGEPTCAGCHALFDPTTFPFDNYDAMGRWQTMLTPAGGLPGSASTTIPVDPQGTLFLPTDGAVDVETRDELLSALVSSTDVQRCVVMQQARFAFGRGLANSCMIEELLTAFEDSGNTLGTLVEDLAAHEAFVMARFE
ncbi:MAG: DUF1592 domain-containing protein [Myxococcota bacterium]